MTSNLPRRLVAEALGTGLLVATVVGSGIMADRLTGDVALALLGNTLPTGAILVVLITILGPISGAHFNPAVTLVFALKRDLPVGQSVGYVAVQIAGGIAGALLAHAMFELPLFQRQPLSELVPRSGWRRRLPPSDSSSRSWRGCASVPKRSLGWWAFTSSRRTGYRLDVVCQPCRGHRPRLHQHLCRHPPCRSAGFHRS